MKLWRCLPLTEMDNRKKCKRRHCAEDKQYKPEEALTHRKNGRADMVKEHNHWTPTGKHEREGKQHWLKGKKGI